MTPCNAIDYAVDSKFAQAVLPRHLALADTLAVSLPDASNRVGIELSRLVAFSVTRSCVPSPFAAHVQHVLVMRALNQVMRIHTTRIIAAVKNLKAISDLAAQMQGQRQAMGKKPFTWLGVSIKKAIAKLRPFRHPVPAVFFHADVDVFPEAVDQV